MAASGLMALLLKSTLCLCLATLLSLLAKFSVLAPGLNTLFFYPPLTVLMLYPPTSILVDLILHFYRKPLWQWTPDPSAIPTDWNLTSAMLLNYAKHGPQIRLRRLIACWIPITVIMLPFETTFEVSTLLEIMVGFALGFFFFALFDRIWAKILNIQIPSLYIQIKSMLHSTILLAQVCAS